VRRLLPVLVALLAFSGTATAARPVRSAIFFYPWYSNPAHDGRYRGWDKAGPGLPTDVATAFFPLRGVYSSGDPRILAAQMRDLRRAGVDEVVSSWWGQGSIEDERLSAVRAAASRRGLVTAVQLEPYPGRTIESVAADLQYFRSLGIRDVYVYGVGDFPGDAWRSLNLRLSGLRVFAQTGMVGFAVYSGFAGFYTYDILVYGGADFRRLCSEAHARALLCIPSVGPGYDAATAKDDLRVKPRRKGATYDSMWRAALAAKADLVSITSYNEWLEGTQIEPADPIAGYDSYNGAYGLRGSASEWAYIRETARWTAVLRRR
jgi:hypothetical protein